MKSQIECLVFYAGQFVERVPFFPSIAYLDYELYNGAFVLVQNVAKTNHWYENGWFKPDGTPYPTEQVPEELRTLALLLT